ncbi:MAG: 4'-phosphopantetheinyl transferase superfamily protein [Gemmobacter sp.]|nr:4'-phosphopantetheinyl transferase superfamily protein [Gemmobacter sp.]
MSLATEAEQVAQRLFPPGVEVAARSLDSPPAPHPSEAPAVAGAVAARRAEFAAGRAAARDALMALGLPPAAIPMGEDRAPCWPRGTSGSITHTGILAVAVVAPARQCAALGIDAEPDEPLPDDLLDIICTASERRWLSTQSNPARWARLIFSAKEAAYKCQFPASRTIFGFECLTITPELATGRLVARFATPVHPFAKGDVLHGRFGIGAGLILAGFSLPAA